MSFLCQGSIVINSVSTLKFAVTSINLDDGTVCPACPKVCTVNRILEEHSKNLLTLCFNIYLYVSYLVVAF